jgi:hypothetical protein
LPTADAQTKGAQSRAKGVPFSPSVKRVVRKLSSRSAVSAWDIVKQLLVLHDEYGDDRASKIREGPGPSIRSRKPVAEWLEEIIALLEPGALDVLHGRQLIVGLTLLDS